MTTREYRRAMWRVRGVARSAWRSWIRYQDDVRLDRLRSAACRKHDRRAADRYARAAMEYARRWEWLT